VPGSLELTELLLVLVIFAGLPLVSLHGEHVVFDSLDPLLPPWLRRVQQVIVDGFCLCALGGIAWLMWTKAGQMTEYGDTTAQLKWPLGPFVYGMSVLCAVTALVHGMLMIKPDLHAGSGAADAPGGA
jgi:TRAP-type C4-dicarboxylate transport system permease small subunit